VFDEGYVDEVVCHPFIVSTFLLERGGKSENEEIGEDALRKTTSPSSTSARLDSQGYVTRSMRALDQTRRDEASEKVREGPMSLHCVG
jgi:hypothetical protein